MIKEGDSIELDFYEKRFEEYAEFPEKKADSELIGEDGELNEESDGISEYGELEEIADFRNEVVESIPIIDELVDSTFFDGGHIDRRVIDTIDVELLSAEVDTLTQIVGVEDANSLISSNEDDDETRDRVEYTNLVEEENFAAVAFADRSIEDVKDTEVLSEDETITLSTDELENIINDPELDDSYSSSKEIEQNNYEEAKQGNKNSVNLNETLNNKNKNTITLEVPNCVLDKLPEDFNMSELSMVNLKEAEEIANEDFQFTTEDEFIKELDELDLMPILNTTNEELKDDVITDGYVEEKDVVGKSEERMTDLEKSKKVSVKHEEIDQMILEEVANSNGMDLKGNENQSIIEEIQDESIIVIDDTPEELNKKEVKEGTEIIESVEENQEGEMDLSVGDMEEPIVNDRLELHDDEGNESFDLPTGSLNIDKTEDNLYIIDDEVMVEDEESESIFEDDELEKISTGIVEIAEGEAIILTETDAQENLRGLGGITSDITPDSEDMFNDTGEKFVMKDEEIDYIDRSFTGKGFGDYIKEDKGDDDEVEDKGIDSMSELLGLKLDEMDVIEDKIYENGNGVNDHYKLANTLTAVSGETKRDDVPFRECTYLLPMDKSLIGEEKRSIEVDLLSSSALVVEEDVKEIIRRLERKSRKRVGDTEDIADISDDIIIIEEVSEKDERQELDQKEMKKLLKYLNGLLEKLPENVIENFAKSEYYELYKKALEDSDG
ncbi:MAG: hypothetical protein SVZ03_16830 [Spirochaetota bacterium]|nr:hypothetical protein [Spirochaetota bacterium]